MKSFINIRNNQYLILFRKHMPLYLKYLVKHFQIVLNILFEIFLIIASFF